MDYYSTLGVPKNASQDDIRKAYKKQSMQHHPDRGGNEEVFKKINEAYSTLKDPAKKQQYDNPQPNFNNRFENNYDDMFSQMFGGMRRRMRNKDILCTAQVDLVDIIKGKRLDIEYNLPSGISQTATVHVPAGIDNNVTIRYQGLGDNAVTGLPRGDLLIKIIIRNPKGWDREGSNLITITDIDPFEAMLGCRKIIRTLENKTLQLTIPPGCQPGQVFSISDHGLVNQQTRRRGNIYVKIKLNVPKVDDKSGETMLQYVKEAQNEYSKIS